ncbi:T9SS type A sorting domain-containing protein [Flammeovirga yaeyamensis]|uniref:T9SS type A sorting domain-containing protein n=1 Tax=Flammeovirga yaeyamensis TaxID=367791 RepID=A0AAX1NBN7_9BACT|nr:T9SS type A sorting domain-containing protein [Flammeovirga yaeyamensis]MBB3697159.1 hypothetical protein [Flammeovirga yaeyamensis]NMF33819.1 T9SS type A sorting domain-containing protein [Flammeovirga yaeyamensis]QWG04917.1 T9SS type A sorting domain-containing protein [Flammeovirga yaeyamensis]
MKNLILLSLFVFVCLAGCTSANEETDMEFEPVNLIKEKLIIDHDSVHEGNFANEDITITNNSTLTINGGTMHNVKFDVKPNSHVSFNSLTKSVQLVNVDFNLNNARGLCVGQDNFTILYKNKPHVISKAGCYGSEDLPVNLIFFKSIKKGKDIELKWATATEENNDYFEVQRSQDMTNWETIERVKGAGNSNTRINYNYVDENVPSVSGVVYHRLKQVDFDGQSTFIGPVAVKMGSTEGEVTIYPNPVAFGKNLKVVSTYDHMKVRIFDVSGRTYYNETILSNLTSIPMNYGKGVLFVEVQNGAIKTTKKIIVH